MLTPALKTIALLLLIGTFSCDKDDEKDPTPVDEFNTEYDNKKYNIKYGFVDDGGSVDVFFDDEATEKTHYNYNFILTDGTPEFENDDVSALENGKILITAGLLSPGTNGFQTGEFELIDLNDWMEMEEEEILETYKDKHFSPLAIIITDSDGDQNWEEETGQVATEGSFKVSGSAPNYTTEYDLTMEDGSKLKGKFTGSFTMVQD